MTLRLCALTRPILPALGLILPLAAAAEVTNLDTSSMSVGGVPVFEQELVVEGEPVQIEIAPVYGDKDWAFTTRWDDNNLNSLNMHAAMAEIGLKGSFYLNGSGGETGTEYAQELSTDGCSVGGHTSHHPFLPTLNANTLFYEILFNRIEREADTDRPINSFAFPFGRFKDSAEPAAQVRITEAWVRSGYHHNVYGSFVQNNPDLPEGYASTGHQVVPGDKKIEADKFREQMAKLLDNAAENQAKTPVISVGVHPWQPPEELEKFKVLLAEYTGRDDFWYANQTDIGAYRFQAIQTEIEPVSGQPGHYALTRPRVNIAGADIPLTVRLNGPEPKAVALDGEPLEVTPGKESGSWLVDLPYPPHQHTPWKIDYTTNGPGFEGREHAAGKFPDVEATLAPLPEGGWRIVVLNQSEAALNDFLVTVRLPLVHQNGIYRVAMDTLPPHSDSVSIIPAAPLNDDPALRDGQLFAAAEIDFVQNGDACRLYSVYLGEPANAGLQPGARDDFRVAGPIAPEQIDPAQLAALSAPDAALPPLNATPLGQWRTPTAEQREIFSRDRIITVSPETSWREAVKPFSRQPANIVATGEFELDQAGPVRIEAGLPVIFAAVDGQEVELTDARTPELPAGPHRLVVVLDTKGRISFNREEPQWLALFSNGKPVALPPAPPHS
ncbi:MAG: polysaccharide deacetylase family protein [Verrucomicrobiota bacterium JB024]|nr:polysaccharide deacetylase family protein [Verrucomicrobiota bacterium JB024]